MIKSKKQSLIVIGVFTLVLALVTTTYAFFNYTRTGSANTIRVGRISFVTRQTETINLANVFPIDKTNVDTDTDNVDSVVIEIEGDTDYAGGIEYLVSSKDANIYTNQGNQVPVSLDITVDDLGTESTDYFTARDNTNASIYKKIVGDTLVGDEMLLVGYIKPNTISGTIEGIDGSITIKAYFDKDKILISDTYDGTESDSMGTTNNQANGKTVITTNEWNALQSSGVSFKVNVEANEGIWVSDGSLYYIMKERSVMDNNRSTYVSASTGIDFGAASSDTNGKGIYMRAGTENDVYPIIYYRGDVTDNNVVFNEKCWKAVRTTDTGGVKLIYNGEPTTIYAENPLSEDQYTIPSGAKNDFTFNSIDSSWEITTTDRSYEEISFILPAGGNYKLIQTVTSEEVHVLNWGYYIDGEYVSSYGNAGESFTDTYLFGILTSSNVIRLIYETDASAASPVAIKLQIVQLGDVIIENSCDNVGDDTLIDISNSKSFSFNNRYDLPAYVGYMWGKTYEAHDYDWIDDAYFGSGFTYNNGVYTLTNATVTTPDKNHHYSCNSSDPAGTCSSIRYVYRTYSNDKYYIIIDDGKGIEEALQEMYTNTNDSKAKMIIDSWYASNMNNVTNKLEDTIWCNDRSMKIENKQNGWIANGGYLGNTELYYGTAERYGFSGFNSSITNQPSLECQNKNDAFTVSNEHGNQKLTYPVAMLTVDEIVLAGRRGNYLNSGSSYWLLSPSVFYDSYYGGYVFYASDSGFGDKVIYYGNGLRPSISLKLGLPIVSGAGTVNDPYVIE